ncbi:uncharacterized protein LOC134286630 [Aedes albopictus]|uniref:CCHC-type domain-containing protein n=1 Tax=Aedes albopictus TaxID=7160 RepID=A0ABM1ZRD5_AEDAL
MLHTPKNLRSKVQVGAQSEDGDNQTNEPVSEQKKNQKKKEQVKKMNEELKVINIQMDALKRKLQRVQVAVAEDPEMPSPNLASKHYLQLQLKTIEDTFADYNDHQKRIYGLNVGDDVHTAAEVKYIEFEQRYSELYVIITKLLDDISQREKLALMQPAPAASPAATPAVAMHLPPLKVPLPTFDGAYENWYAFKSMFETIMDRYQSESPAIKLYHLRNSLVGKAAGIIDQEIINNNDYATAWATLTERFENKRLIIDKHIDALFDLPKMCGENAVDLRRLIDTCTKNTDALKNLNLPVDGLGESMLINRISKKLDDETRKAWELDQGANGMPDYDSTMKFLRERCRVLEKIRPTEKRLTKPPIKSVKQIVEAKSKGSSFVVTSEKCPQCSSNHKLWKCDAFRKVPLAERYGTLRRVGACFNCLQKGHRTAECSSEHSCKKCSKRHHTMLHPTENPAKKNESPVPPTVTPAGEQKTSNQNREASTSGDNSKSEGRNEQQRSSLCTRPETGKQILLSTALILVYGRASNPYPCRVLLDSGSHTNFVSEQFATLLGLKKQPAHYSISGLNETQTKVRFKIFAKLESRTTDYSTCQELLVVPKITGDLPITKIDPRRITVPEAIELADPKFGIPDKVDMLLGAEVFFDMLKSGRVRVPDCAAVFQETQFGWVLSGPIPEEKQVFHSFCVRAEEDVGHS